MIFIRDKPHVQVGDDVCDHAFVGAWLRISSLYDLSYVNLWFYYYFFTRVITCAITYITYVIT